MTYKIPFSYTVNCTIPIEASDLASAIDKIEHLSGVESDGSCRLIHGFSPIIKSNIDFGSIQIDMEYAEDLNPEDTSFTPEEEALIEALHAGAGAAEKARIVYNTWRSWDIDHDHGTFIRLCYVLEECCNNRDEARGIVRLLEEWMD